MRVFLTIVLAGTLASVFHAQEICLACTTQEAATPATTAAVEELERIDAEIDRASVAGETAAVAALFHGDMIAVESGTITGRDEVLARITPPRPSTNKTVSASAREVRVFGDAAVVVADKTQTFLLNGRPESFRWHETNTYVRRQGGWLLIASQSSNEPGPYAARDVAFDLEFDPAQAQGDRAAPIVLYEFSDYECPHCRRFATQTLPRIQDEYVRSGRVALVLRDQPLDMHPHAFAAAAASQCAARQGKLWAMNERMMRDPVALGTDDLARDAREIGLDTAQFDRCLQDSATGERIRKGLDEAAAMGIKGTPMFIVGVRAPGEAKVRALRLIEGAYPYEVFKTTLDGVVRARGR